MPDPLLKIENLSSSFFIDGQEIRAINGIDLTIHRGETLGLVGESGCGKSLTALSIMRLLPSPPAKIVAGQIIYNRQNLVTLPNKAMRKIRGKQISMIFQEPLTSLNPVFTVGKQIMEVVLIHHKCKRHEAKSKALEMMEFVGIPAPVQRFKEYPHQLSGGMRQRIMIAIALACEPNLLIADEPTTALDVTIQAQILALINHLRQKRQMAVLFISHDLAVIAQNAHRVAVMYAGNIVESASVDDLFQNPLHPYTQALLAALPQPTDQANKERKRLFAIPGAVPELTKMPSGCRFHPRCPQAFSPCKEALPGLFSTDNLHQVRCYLYETCTKKS